MFHKKDEARNLFGSVFLPLFGKFFLFSGFAWRMGTSISPAGAEIDKDKYIPFDEVKPGMKGYCLTVYKGTVA